MALTAVPAGGRSGPARAQAPGATAADDQPTRTARVWSTTPDRVNLIREVGTVQAQAPSAGASSRLEVDATTAGQSIVGFGAALTHSSAFLLAGLSAAERRRVLVDLFDPLGAVRLSVVRIPLGGSDFVVGAPRTFDDLAAGKTDWSLRRFSTSMDERTLRPVLREIRAINPGVVVVASPWSAPAWMKDTRSLVGGRLSGDARAIPTFANYLVRALLEYRSAGVPIDVLTVQNEPQTRWPADYPRMEMPVAQQVALINAVGPGIRSAGLATRILGFDHNWTQHPVDRSAVPPGGDLEDDYALRVLRSTAAPWVAGVAFHCYSGDASAQEPIHDAFPGADIWVTECSGTRATTDTAEKTFADTLYWHSRNLLLPSLDHWASAVLTWNLALDPTGGPHTGGCATCTPVVTIANGAATPEADYFVLAHAARFLPRGSVRVGSTANNPEFAHVAFRTPDGSIVALLHQAGWQTSEITLTVEGAEYRVPVSPWSMTTVRIRP